MALQNKAKKQIVAFETIFDSIEILLSFYLQAIILMAYAEAAATVPEGRLFIDKFGQLDDISMVDPAGNVKPTFYIINDKIMDWDMDLLVQQQREAIPP